MLFYKNYNLVLPIKRYSYFILEREDGRGNRIRTCEVSESKSDALPLGYTPMEVRREENIFSPFSNENFKHIVSAEIRTQNFIFKSMYSIQLSYRDMGSEEIIQIKLDYFDVMGFVEKPQELRAF